MRLLSLVLIAAALTASGCDTPPGAELSSDRAPVVSDFEFGPADVDLADLDPQLIGDGVVNIPMHVSVRVDRAPDDLDGVRYLVRRPDRSPDALADGALTPQGDGRYRADFTVTLNSGAIGNYAVAVYAVDAGGRMSNQVSGMLRYRATGSPPVIEHVQASPNPFTPPGELVMVVTVSDPDGLENIARVVGTTPTGVRFDLFDDGESQGDEVAGDGRYTARFDVPTATPGQQVFSFQAIDLTGLESEVVEYPVTIQ